jgi:hypothetical protein
MNSTVHMTSSERHVTSRCGQSCVVVCGVVVDEMRKDSGVSRRPDPTSGLDRVSSATLDAEVSSLDATLQHLPTSSTGPNSYY